MSEEPEGEKPAFVPRLGAVREAAERFAEVMRKLDEGKPRCPTCDQVIRKADQ